MLVYIILSISAFLTYAKSYYEFYSAFVSIEPIDKSSIPINKSHLSLLPQLKQIPYEYRIHDYIQLQNDIYNDKKLLFTYRRCNCDYPYIDYGNPFSVTLKPETIINDKDSIIFVVCSQHSEVQLRDLFRRQSLYYRQHYNISYAFVMTDNKTDPTIEKSLRVEQHIHKDILLFNHTNNYANLVLTVLFSYHYLYGLNLSNRYVVKTDVDCALNFQLIIDLLNSAQFLDIEDLYTGFCFDATLYRASPQNKHYVPKSIYRRERKVKGMAMGGLYALSYKLLPKLLISVRHLPFLTHQEDVTVARALQYYNISCQRHYKTWLGYKGCSGLGCKQFAALHPNKLYNTQYYYDKYFM